MVFSVAQRNGYIRRFTRTGALSPDRALTLPDLRIRDSRIFQRLIRRGLVHQVGEDRFYLDLEQTQNFLAAERRLVLGVWGGVIATLVVILVALALLSRG